MNEYYKVEISAEDQDQADQILNSLLDKRLVTGGQFIHAPARFLWKGKVQDMDYVTIYTYTNIANKDAVMADIARTSSEEVPMVSFFKIDYLSPEFQQWIDKTLS